MQLKLFGQPSFEEWQITKKDSLARLGTHRRL
jgi:hypothetical protein